MFDIHEYRKCISKKYDLEQENGNLGLQVNPTPADIRDFTLGLLSEEIEPRDLAILKRFFVLDESKDYARQIDAFPLPKFRPIQSLFDGSKQSDKEKMLDFAALIVNFQPRPFQKFRKSAVTDRMPDENVSVDKASDIENPTVAERPDVPPVIIVDMESDSPENINGPAHDGNPETHEPGLSDSDGNNVGWWTKYRRNTYIGGVAIAALGAVALALTLKTDSPACMQWLGDHYEIVDCSSTRQSNENLIEAVDTLQVGMRKVLITAETIYFKDGRPVVWYSKNDTVECFDRDGYHPVNRKKLKLVSRHMAMMLRGRFE
ncbi:MAG: hypothetical protein EOO50_02630 [Flavobacterium sp.]|uniref:hypothetical protein n=1 Tax=Flavobacterium sp. TaxID=239 RepID=UPI00120F51A6|nr:hypothetical protein [Flavobacterium sp.]RZJ68334.1 MAG: hypothetical protein EOO50_02630 [Flavobacterium sp.]